MMMSFIGAGPGPGDHDWTPRRVTRCTRGPVTVRDTLRVAIILSVFCLIALTCSPVTVTVSADKSCEGNTCGAITNRILVHAEFYGLTYNYQREQIIPNRAGGTRVINQCLATTTDSHLILVDINTTGFHMTNNYCTGPSCTSCSLYSELTDTWDGYHFIMEKHAYNSFSIELTEV
jgi:hypothetical protein